MYLWWCHTNGYDLLLPIPMIIKLQYCTKWSFKGCIYSSPYTNAHMHARMCKHIHNTYTCIYNLKIYNRQNIHKYRHMDSVCLHCTKHVVTLNSIQPILMPVSGSSVGPCSTSDYTTHTKCHYNIRPHAHLSILSVVFFKLDTSLQFEYLTIDPLVVAKLVCSSIP